MRVDMHNICGHFRWKQPSTKRRARGCLVRNKWLHLGYSYERNGYPAPSRGRVLTNRITQKVLAWLAWNVQGWCL